MRRLSLLLILITPLIAKAQGGLVELSYQQLHDYKDKGLNMNFFGVKLGKGIGRNSTLYLGMYLGSQKIAAQGNQYMSPTSGMEETMHATLMNRMNRIDLGFSTPVFIFPVRGYPHFLEAGAGIHGLHSLNKVSFGSSEVTQFDEDGEREANQVYKMGKRFRLGYTLSAQACFSLARSPGDAMVPYVVVGYRLGFGGLNDQPYYSFTDDASLAAARVEEKKSKRTYYFKEGTISNSVYGCLTVGLLFRVAPDNLFKKGTGKQYRFK